MRTMALAMRTGISSPDFLENDLIFVLHFVPQDGACNSSVGHHRNLIEAEPCDREHRGPETRTMNAVDSCVG